MNFFLLLLGKDSIRVVLNGVSTTVHYFGGWVECAKSLCCQGLADRQPYRTGGGPDFLFWREKIAHFNANFQNEHSKWTFLETGKFNGCFLGKTSLTKNFQMILRGLGGGSQIFITDFENSVSRPVFHSKKNGRMKWALKIVFPKTSQLTSVCGGGDELPVYVMWLLCAQQAWCTGRKIGYHNHFCWSELPCDDKWTIANFFGHNCVIAFKLNWKLKKNIYLD